MTSVPSRPRFTRPLFSVRHSPRLTKRNGVLMRMAPPRTARATLETPPEPSAMSGRPAPVERLGEEDADEEDALQDVDRRVGQVEDALEQAAARADPAQQQRHGYDGERVAAREEGDEHARVAVARDERRVGRAVDGGDLDRAREAGASAADERRDDDEATYGEAVQHRGAHVAAHHARGEAEGRAVHEDRTREAREQPQREAPVDVEAGYVAEHVVVADGR